MPRRAVFMVKSALGENLTVADDVLRHVKDGHSLAHAIVDTVREALIVLDRDLRVVAASRSFYQTFGANPQDTQGHCHTEQVKAVFDRGEAG